MVNGRQTSINYELPRLSPSLSSSFSSLHFLLPSFLPFVFETVFHSVAQADLELEAILLPQSLSGGIIDTTHHAQLAKFLYINTAVLTLEAYPSMGDIQEKC